jgi:hypothetical protein
MPDHIAVLVLAGGGLVAFLVYKGVQWARAAREERFRNLRALGFEPLEPPPTEVVEFLLALHGGKKRVTDLFERRGSAERLYLFDLQDNSGESSAHEALAVFSPRLELPRLTISPRIGGDGRLAALGNRLLKKLARRRGKAVEFPSHPRFAQRHLVNAPDEEAARRFLTPDRLDRLAAMGRMVVEGEGGRFTYQRIRFQRRAGHWSDRQEIAERVQDAEELLRTFATRRR